MDRPPETIAAEHKLAQVDSLLWSLERTRTELLAYRAALTEKIGILRETFEPGFEEESQQSSQSLAGREPERRSARRRPGHPVSVDILNSEDVAGPGWIVDRSVGGIGLWADDAEPIGALLRVRAAGAAEGALVVVKHCQADRTPVRLGCQFVGHVPWPVLRQFG